jgi:S-adenosylmethionine hydrolase
MVFGLGKGVCRLYWPKLNLQQQLTMSLPVITLLSDLGTGDPALVSVRAALMSTAAGAVVVDISHCVPDYDVRQGAYMLQTAYGHFPQGTVHVALIDCIAGEQPRLLLARWSGYWFVAPDNGLLQLALGGSVAECYMCRAFAKGVPFRDWVAAMAEVIGVLDGGGTISYAPWRLEALPAVQQGVVGDSTEALVLCTDRYENVVLGLRQKEFMEAVGERPFRIHALHGDITTVSRNYHDVAPGEPLCRFNTGGYLEIAVNRGSALEVLGLKGGTDLRYSTVRIIIEKSQEPANS